jgi:hypothetical protein
MSFLKNHPFEVEAFFEHSIVLTFAFPKQQIAHLIPECLTLDTFNDEWAFIAVAFVQTKNLRPKGFPEFLGNNFVLIGYRVFVRYTNNAGKRLRGLYILKSETDKKLMEIMGNIFTHYNYTTTDIIQEHDGQKFSIRSKQSNLKVELETSETVVELPELSPFADWKEARRFAGPLPFTFTYTPSTKEVLIIEGVRESWIPAPVKVLNYHIPFLNSPGMNNGILANSFIIKNIPYYWKKGKTEQWKP